MPTGTRQLKRRNHTVNKLYLRRFADDRGLLTRVTLPGEVRVPISVDDATVVKNFYVVQLDDRSESDEAEDLFSMVEGNAVAAIRALVDQRVWPIPGRCADGDRGVGGPPGWHTRARARRWGRAVPGPSPRTRPR